MNAGRGIGMSIVKDGLVALGGTINVATASGKGTEFSISVPTRETLIKGLVYEVGTRLFAIPLSPEIRIISDREETNFHQGGMEVRSKLQISQIAEAAALNPVQCGIVEFSSTPVRVYADRFVGVEHILLDDSFPDPIEQMPALRRGRIDLSSEVHILDPDAIASHLKKEFAAARPIPSADFWGSATEYVLVVDDSAVVRRSHEELVKKERLNCITANDGLEALEIILGKTSLPAAIITDYEMPRMNGLELTEHLKRREAYSGIPIFLVTSNTDPEIRTAAARCGIAGVFLKPIDPEILKRALLDCLAVSG
jgi:chemosensory pili system protein ChpA (sensor histidine kinase/response regulator)